MLLVSLMGVGCSALGNDPFGDAAIADAEVTPDASPPVDAPSTPDAAAAPDADQPDAAPTDA